MKASVLAMAALAQSHADNLVCDENLKTVKLENGLTLMVFKNQEPPQRVSMRLAVKKGSIAEKEDEQGLAHFIEHMAFKGTKNFPAGDMIEYFQRLGMAFGADNNAHTSFDETVYKIDMPEVKYLQEGLRLLADYASTVSFEKSAIDSERGVIIAEKKSRDTVDYRAFVSEWKMIFEGTDFALRLPIGQDDIIKKAPREKFVEFYNATYRPENMAIVIVGDIDVEKTLKVAADIFSSISPSKDVSARLNPGTPSLSEDKFEASLASLVSKMSGEVFIDKELKNSSAEILIKRNARFKGDSFEGRVEDLKISAIEYILNRRFEKIASEQNSKITKGAAGFTNLFDVYDLSFISADAPAGNSRMALETISTELERALKYGFTDKEIAEAISKILNLKNDNVERASTRQTPYLSNKISSTFTNNRLFLSPQTEFALAEVAYAKLDAKSAHVLFKEIFTNGLVRYFITDTKPIGYNPLEIVKVAAQEDIFAPEQEADIAFAHYDYEGDGKIVSEKYLEDLQIKQLVFENGVRVNLKKTDFAANEIIIRADIGGGKLDFDESNIHLSLIANAHFVAGGTSAHKYDDIESIFAAETVSIAFEAEESCFKLSGKTNKKFLEHQLALLRAYILHAGFNTESYSKAQKEIAELFKAVKTTPELALRANVMKWYLSGNFRFGFPEEFTPTLSDLDNLKKFLGKILKEEYLELSIVGDFEEDACKALVSAIFGTMPKRNAERRDYSKLKELTLTASPKKVFEVQSESDRAIAAVLWQTCPMSDIDKARQSNVVAEILDDVMRKQIREKLGQVYSPFAYNNSNKFYNFGYLFAGSLIEVKYSENLIKLLEECALEVSKEITQDQFERAKLPIIKQVEKLRRTNEYWLSNVLSFSQSEDFKLAWARSIVSGCENISLDDVRIRAKQIFDSAQFKIIIIKPEKL